jgi:ATP-dependent Lon protease
MSLRRNYKKRLVKNGFQLMDPLVSLGSNGVNGISGISTNGISTNGISTNGISTNGISTNGTNANGGMNGTSMNGGANGTNANGGTNGTSMNGTTMNGGGGTNPGGSTVNPVSSTIRYFQEVIQRTIISIQNYKTLEIVGANDMNLCVVGLEKCFSDLHKIQAIVNETNVDFTSIRSQLQMINNALSDVFRKYGTQYLDDLLIVCFGKSFLTNMTSPGSKWNLAKFDIIHKYFHPFQYKVVAWKNGRNPTLQSSVTNNLTDESVIQKTRIVDDIMIVEKSENLDCFDLSRSAKAFKTRVYGMKLAIHNEAEKKTLIVSGIVDNIMLDCVVSPYVEQKIAALKAMSNMVIISEGADIDSYHRYIQSLTLKELLVYECRDLTNKYAYHITQLKMIKQMPISQLVKIFMNSELYSQRTTLIQLLLKNNSHEYQYLAYLLYDILSNDSAIECGGGGGLGVGVGFGTGAGTGTGTGTGIGIGIDDDTNSSSSNDSNSTTKFVSGLPDVETPGSVMVVSGSSVDTKEQCELYDSLPWNMKKYFKDAMNQTIKYTKMLANYDINKIPLEQQICLMKTSDAVKEKAMLKLKEIRSKSEDSGSKARQYLEGLLKIPFGTYKHEPILSVMTNIRIMFSKMVINISQLYPECDIKPSPNYTNIEIYNHLKTVETKYIHNIIPLSLKQIKENILDDAKKRDVTVDYINSINAVIKEHKLRHQHLRHSGKTHKFMRNEIERFFDFLIEKSAGIQQPQPQPQQQQQQHQQHDGKLKIDIVDKKCSLVMADLMKAFTGQAATEGQQCKGDLGGVSQKNMGINDRVNGLVNDAEKIKHQWAGVNQYITNANHILDAAVHGHKRAKRHIERILGQWINGEQSGYCFGFEGPPGVGKTSLAKNGLAKCLTDENGVARPFAFIAIGGSSNGSTLEGHNYTYVGSTWGRIVEILMETKCMNPIIFIDELDKVSKTEHGREIIGILTHLIDPTQNDVFQDKYFNGIDLDLSKAMFVFSYNDVDSIDKILLDRIHRIKFDNLSLDDKLVIAEKHILPDIYTKMGLVNMIQLTTENLIYIIDYYTCEPGVRKLKEILFEIIGEINLDYIKSLNCYDVSAMAPQYELPICITNEMIRDKYLKERHQVHRHSIHPTPSIGIINGLWANALGNGGIIPIEAYWFPCATMMDLKLTGMQGDVMKESMTVAKTLAWGLLDEDVKKGLIQWFDATKTQGLHIHCPEGATPKDGPSAGTAITCVMYSLFSRKPIKNTIAITGEINLQGNVTKIGGLDLKILGGVKAGVKEFLFPFDNTKDFNDFYEKYKDKDVLNEVVFRPVKTIQEVFAFVF